MRLKEYDYAQNGAYFITICTQDRQKTLCEIVGAIHNRPQVILSEYGKQAEASIEKIQVFSGMCVDKYCIMPNHIHMILTVNLDTECGRLRIAPTSVSVTVQQMKRRVSKALGSSIWQRGFHDHIIRNEADYQKIWQYIEDNPAKWQEDVYYTQ